MTRLRMMPIILAAALVCVIPAAARTRAVRHSMLDAQRLLWIGAHPDDESLAAPVLGPMCTSDRVQCSMLVLTRGENGDCALPGGCGDLGALRSAEMSRAAALFDATLTQWSLPDTNGWDDPTLVTRIRDAISSANPDLIITFDPHHGSSCHPAHRQTAQLVLDAVATLPHPPRVLLLETAVSYEHGIDFANAAPDASSYAANEDWAWLLRDLRTHASQFGDTAVALVANAPPSQRFVWLLPSERAAHAQYAVQCR